MLVVKAGLSYKHIAWYSSVKILLMHSIQFVCVKTNMKHCQSDTKKTQYHLKEHKVWSVTINVTTCIHACTHFSSFSQKYLCTKKIIINQVHKVVCFFCFVLFCFSVDPKLVWCVKRKASNFQTYSGLVHQIYSQLWKQDLSHFLSNPIFSWV